MQYHAKAVLTAAQRTQVRQLHQQGRSQAALARQFDVHRRTIQRWVARDEPTDRSSAPHHHGHQVVTEDYRRAVLDHRAAPIPRTVPNALPTCCATAFRPPTLPLSGASCTAPACRGAPPQKRARRPIPVGRHRVQLDIQELPAIRGNRKREYKISLIHLRTRLKYSEIHPSASSKRVAEVLRRAIGRLPPFFLVVTDNAMVFTMAYTAHPERRTAFERTLAELGLTHMRIARRSPWQNGFIERSNRTDNDECFHRDEFTSSEYRRYQHRLWEMHYNTARPHQSLDGATPWTAFCRDYPLHAAATNALIY